jgi:hypothetical protein
MPKGKKITFKQKKFMEHKPITFMGVPILPKESFLDIKLPEDNKLRFINKYLKLKKGKTRAVLLDQQDYEWIHEEYTPKLVIPKIKNIKLKNSARQTGKINSEDI